ncbi:AAA family ATPase [Breoghania sp.]|uniref:AAA family ATPase n=1 Tax=Breoghania sp. TaxID=2065378 RepID=UPI0029C9CC15|nr:AAA family ATPase [Breoghania sp.]
MRLNFPSDPPPPPMTWLAPGLIPLQGLTVLSGPPGGGKSALATALAVAASEGGKWLGGPIEPTGVVLWLAYEAVASTTRRIRSVAPKAKIAVASDLPLLSADKATGVLRKAVEQVSDHFGRQVGLVIVDAFAAAMRGGDENSGRDVGKALEPLLTLAEHLPVMLISHTGKAGGAETRGHSSVTADATAALAVVRNGSSKRLRTIKQRDAEPAADVTFRLEERSGSPWPVPVAADAARPRSASLPPDAQLMLEVISDFKSPVEFEEVRAICKKNMSCGRTAHLAGAVLSGRQYPTHARCLASAA